MSLRPRLRFTPTPSGFLHKGNALNFVLVWWQAKILKGDILLRIDDHDETRVRDEYLDDIFEVLNWLELDWQLGPKNKEDHKLHFSQSLRKSFYQNELKKLQKRHQTFWCECSRKELESSDNGYPGTCRDKGLQGDHHLPVALRLNTDGLGSIDLDFKDCILWRKDDLPSYQWVSLLEDREQEITHVIRGHDLKGSSRFQKSLAESLGFAFPGHLFHHQLIEEEGKKISKSTKASSLFDEFSRPEHFFEEVITPFLTKITANQAPVRKARDLLNFPQNLFK